MDVDNVPPNPCRQTPPTSDHKVADSHLKSNVGKLKFEDASRVGSNGSEECTLILSQAGYATQFARSALPLLGKDKYAVFPLDRKLLNVRDVSPERLVESPTIQKITRILGLQPGSHFPDNNKELRYGHLMFMVTQGHDGSRIIGLLITFLRHFWPSLLQVDKFMQRFITPMVNAVHKKTNAVLPFYTMPDFDDWRKESGIKATEYSFKGPGPIASPEESNCFVADFHQHIKDFYWADSTDDHAIKHAFFMGRRTQEKTQEICSAYLQAGTDVDSKDKRIRYLDFFNKEFMQYLEADHQRSIPSIVDGLTLSQRKVLSHALKMPLTHKIGVGQLSAYVFDHTPYIHSEASLVGTIIGMAQNYVGSNNINLLQPIGRFGTRMRGGKDHDASGGYLFTQLSPITQYLFHKDHELIFKYLNGDGRSVELPWFFPIIPMVLVNGSKGCGTGCSSFIPNYNPRDIIANLIRLLNGRKVLPMDPWYKGFTGDIKKKALDFTTEGVTKMAEDGTMTVTELPVGMWTENYEGFLKAASRRGDIIKAYKDYNDYDNAAKVHIEITMADKMKSAKQEEILNKFKLKTTLSTANMHLLDKDGELKKYAYPEDILEEFFHLRLKFYKKWRTALLRELEIASRLLENKVRYISEVRNGEILLFPIKDKDKRCAELKTKGFKSLPSIEQEVDRHTILSRSANGEETEEKEPGTGYDYLLSIPIGSFRDDEFKELEQEKDLKINECAELSKSTHESLWERELTALDLQLAKKYTVKINSKDVDSEKAEEAPKKKAPAKRRATRPQRANKKSRMR